ncbi:MAG: agmatinase [Candidatus Eisenbacteria bacterium]|nr:agmatinase [Candidatus Eisenbacteria bacterium]
MPSPHTGGEFLGLPPEAADVARARVVVLPIPYEATTTYRKGTGLGPSAILAASAQVEFFDETERDEPCFRGIHTLPPLDATGSPEEVVARIENAAATHAGAGRFVLALGGEHTVTVGAARGVARGRGPLTVVQIDAHADLRNEYEGSPLNHACVMRRLLTDFPIVQVGIRAFSSEEDDLIRRRSITAVTAREIASSRGSYPETATDAPWIRRALAAVATDAAYLTVDLDGLDPSVVPAVGTPDPGGLLWYEALAFIEALFAERAVVAADVVELCPAPDSARSDYAAARLAYKIAGHALRA